MGYRAEKFKSFLVGLHEPIRVIFLLMLLVMGFFALRSWKATNDMVGASHAKLDDILDRLNEKLGALDTAKLNAIADSVKSRIDALEPIQTALTKTVDQARTEMVLDSAEIRNRLRTFDTVLVSLRGVGDETRAQIKQNGDSLNRTVEESTKAVASLNRTITDADTRVTKLLDDGSLLLETANPRVQNILDHSDALIIDADGRIKAFEPIQTGLAGMAKDGNAITTDSKNKLHEILYPPKVSGVWPNIKRTFSYLLTPIMDGARIYFQLHALPVKITQSIPLR